MKRILPLLYCLLAATSLHAANDILIADFEGETYGDWKVEGNAFGSGPAHGSFDGQRKVSGFVGNGLVNSFQNREAGMGKLASPEFKIERRFINFLIGGGGFDGETCINLLIGGKVVRTDTGANTQAGGSGELLPSSWDVAEFVGKSAVIEIVDQRTGAWGYINVDQIEQSDTRKGFEKTLRVDGTHLIVPVANTGKPMQFRIYEGRRLVQSFNVALPQGNEPYWLAAYPLDHFGLKGKTIKLNGATFPETCQTAFERIKIGTASDALKADDYELPYRDQFHATTRRGWNNDPNGMVYHNGKYHLYYQYNPFGIVWGNMHWGHLESADLIHWEEKPIALFQRTLADMAFSGCGIVDRNNTAGLGKDTLFIAFTSTARGECLAYSKDGGITFAEVEENPVVKHAGRDPQIIWYEPEQKWVMTVYSNEPCEETNTIPPSSDRGGKLNSIVFYESKNLRQWKRTGAFTDPDREAVFECPNLIELPIAGKPGETRWILFGAANRFLIGEFDGKTFIKESGPHGSWRRIIYASQLFSNVPDGRAIQIGWARNARFPDRYPDQIVSQGFTLPQELTLKATSEGLRVCVQPVKEAAKLRDKLLTTSPDELKVCEGEQTEVLIEFETGDKHALTINGIDASFTGRSARIFTDRTLNEVYVDGGLDYFGNSRSPGELDSRKTAVSGGVKSLQVYRLRSIWNRN